MSGWKQWTREMLSSAELQSYLQNQVVLKFDSASQRESVLVAPTEGMISYLADQNRYWWHDGNAWCFLGGRPIRSRVRFGVSGPYAANQDIQLTAAFSSAAELDTWEPGDLWDGNAKKFVIPFAGRWRLRVVYALTGTTSATTVWITRAVKAVTTPPTASVVNHSAITAAAGGGQVFETTDTFAANDSIFFQMWTNQAGLLTAASLFGAPCYVELEAVGVAQ